MTALAPDTKDWTWVLERPCPDCGFDTTAVAPGAAPELVGRIASEWRGVLSSCPAPAQRTRPDRWSVLEYACHVRDVFGLAELRLARMLLRDGPTFENWDQDRTAVEEDYASQDPSAVAGQVVAAAGSLAAVLTRISGEQWGRPGFRSDGARFTVESFTRYVLHDPVHHLWDVGAPGLPPPVR